MMKQLDGINALKTIGIIMIVLGHLSILVGIPSYLNFIKARFGLAVQLFFIMSGFSLCYGYYDRLNSQAELKKYYIRRFFRIAPLFYLMIAIWGIYLYFRYGMSFTPYEYLINVSFTFNFFPGLQESIVYAGWFLGVLCLFYLIFPIFVTLVRRVISAILLLVVMLFLASYYYKTVSVIPGLELYSFIHI
ncbi:MAG: acyltransferase family protein [Candidatus Helarchaeota archaeon]